MNREVGPLRHGNMRGDPSKAPRCGAKTRRGTPCLCPAMRRRRRCRLHGGKSTGPRTLKGVERSRRARWRHGCRSREVRELLAKNRRQVRFFFALLEALPPGALDSDEDLDAALSSPKIARLWRAHAPGVR